MNILFLVLKYTIILILFILLWGVAIPILMSYPNDTLVLIGFILIPVSITGFIIYIYKEIRKNL